MDVVLPLLGIVIVVATVVDFAWTTLTARGAGPLTRAISDGLWQAASRLDTALRSRRVRSIAGPAILLTTLFAWFLLGWLGWVLIFLADPAGVVSTGTGAAADFWGFVYFVGFTVTDLGVGDYVPRGPLWQALTIIAAFNGLVQITLSVTYLVSVVSSFAQLRALAAQITSLGASPEDIVIRAWDGEGFAPLSQILSALGPQLALYAQRQRAFPIVRYFFSGDRRTASGPALATLDEALLLLACGVAPEKRPPAMLLEMVRRAIGMAVEPPVLTSRPSDLRQPPLPEIARLAEAGIPVVDGFGRSLAPEDKDRRGRLLDLVETQGWRWEDI